MSNRCLSVPCLLFLATLPACDFKFDGQTIRLVVRVPEEGRPVKPATVESVMEQPALRLVLDNEWSISRVGDRTHVTLGIPGSTRGTLVKPPLGKYTPDLLDALTKAGRAVGKLGREEVERRFAEFVRSERRPASGAASRPGK